MFTARLKNLLNYYQRNRLVDKDYVKSFDLLVGLADKLNESLSLGPLQFLLSKKGTELFEDGVVTDLADIHVSNRIGLVFPNRTNFEHWGRGKKSNWKVEK